LVPSESPPKEGEINQLKVIKETTELNNFRRSNHTINIINTASFIPPTHRIEVANYTPSTVTNTSFTIE
jgi:hypothetical protein